MHSFFEILIDGRDEDDSMVHGNSSKGNKPNSKRQREFIPSKKQSNHYKRECHDNRIQNDDRLRETIELEGKDGKDNNDRYKECR